MSELKAMTVLNVQQMGCYDNALVYFKSEADKAIARYKYKHCLDMAYVEWLKQMTLCYNPESILYRRAYRRERKWKELAKKFKPNNSTAQ